jgi:hypothetical protein
MSRTARTTASPRAAPENWRTDTDDPDPSAALTPPRLETALSSNPERFPEQLLSYTRVARFICYAVNESANAWNARFASNVTIGASPGPPTCPLPNATPMAGGGAAIVPIAAGRRASRFGIVKNQSWFGDLRTKIGGRFFGVSQTEKRFSGKPRHTTTHKHAHTTPSALSSNVTIGMETRARKKKRLDATAANAGEAIPGLLNDIVVTHVLRPEHFDDPADLARLPAVSHAMRDAMASMGLRGTPLNANTCSAAAEGGHLEVLQWARANGCPWNDLTCTWAAKGGHLEVLQWACANGYPWNMWTCENAA